MRHTLVAAFANTLDANRTRGDLMARGIPREHIHSVGADSAEIHAYDAPYTATSDTVDRDHHDTKVTGFFKSLFGGHEEHYRHHATVYPEVVRRGGLVIAVDVYSDQELAKVRDALEYNNAIDINDSSGKYAGISSSPYVGATGGDTHLDTHRDHLDRYKDDPEKLRELRRNEQHYQQRTGAHEQTGAMASSERYSESERPGAGGPIGSTSGAGRTSDSTATGYGGSTSANTGRYDVGSAGKRAGTDYPSTTATTSPTGAGTTGHGSSVGGSDVGRTSASDVGGESRVGSAGVGTGTGSMGSSTGSTGSSSTGTRTGSMGSSTGSTGSPSTGTQTGSLGSSTDSTGSPSTGTRTGSMGSSTGTTGSPSASAGSMGGSSAGSPNTTGSNLGEGSDSSVPRGDCSDRVCIIRRSDNDTYPR